MPPDDEPDLDDYDLSLEDPVVDGPVPVSLEDFRREDDQYTGPRGPNDQPVPMGTTLSPNSGDLDSGGIVNVPPPGPAR